MTIEMQGLPIADAGRSNLSDDLIVPEDKYFFLELQNFTNPNSLDLSSTVSLLT